MAFVQKLSAAHAAIRPIMIFAYMLIVIAVLAVVGCIFPDRSIMIAQCCNVTIPSTARWLGLEQKTEVEHFTFSVKTKDILGQHPMQSSIVKPSLPFEKSAPSNIRSLPAQPIELPNGNAGIFSKLKSMLHNADGAADDALRILHYGDSQIEGDRISGFLRSQFQRRYGGGGVGYLPLNPAIPINPTVGIALSEGWLHSPPLVKYNYRIPLPVGHLLSASTAASSNVWIKINRRALRNYEPLWFSQVKLLLKNTEAPRSVEILTASGIMHKTKIVPKDEAQQVVVNVDGSSEFIIINLRGASNLTLYGIALDARGGITIDNIPLRSSAGTDFVKTDMATMKQCMALLNVAMIVLQFGVNVVPHQAANYKYYEEQVFRQLKRLQQASPQTPILVVGVSDIARRGAGGVLASYPNIEMVRNAQRNAALRAGCAFWDTYQAMGGQNSIISWVYARPPLAAKDFCHFTPKGISFIGELLWEAMLACCLP
jgi:hypothetical protein